MDAYIKFLRSKIDIAPETGFEVQPEEINPALMPHQRDAVIWACKGGCRALFEKFGLGKTVQELEYCKQVIAHKGGRALIVMPLEVRNEFISDAVNLLHIDAPVYVRNMAEVKACTADIMITNYERVRDGDIDPAYFTAVSLDEASILRSFGSKTYQVFLPKFRNVPYKLVATATPAPNKYKEMIHYAGYLGVMDTGQALTRWFKRDSTKANNLTLYPGKEEEFWLWVSSWALYISKPSDLGYDDTGYDLPPMQVNYHKLKTQIQITADKQTGQEQMFDSAAVGIVQAMRIKRNSIDARVQAAKEIVDAHPGEHFILWHDLEAERHAIKKALPENQIIQMYKQFSRTHVYNYEGHIADVDVLAESGRLSKTFETAPARSWSRWIWDDINRMRTLNTAQSQRRKTMHVCPLQIDIVERVIERYSNPGDVVLDPFGGLMTVPETAVKMERYGYGIELNADYFRDGVEYCQSAEAEIEQPTLFDFMQPHSRNEEAAG